MISLVLAICVIVLWRQTVALRRRIASIESRLALAPERIDTVSHSAAVLTDAAPAHAPLEDARTPTIPPSPALSGATTSAAAVASPHDAPAPFVPPTVTPPAAPAAAPVASRAETGRPAEGWEVEVGSNWLNSDESFTETFTRGTTRPR